MIGWSIKDIIFSSFSFELIRCREQQGLRGTGKKLANDPKRHRARNFSFQRDSTRYPSLPSRSARRTSNYEWRPLEEWGKGPTSSNRHGARQSQVARLDLSISPF